MGSIQVATGRSNAEIPREGNLHIANWYLSAPLCSTHHRCCSVKSLRVDKEPGTSRSSAPLSGSARHKRMAVPPSVSPTFRKVRSILLRNQAHQHKAHTARHLPHCHLRGSLQFHHERIASTVTTTEYDLPVPTANWHRLACGKPWAPNLQQPRCPIPLPPAPNRDLQAYRPLAGPSAPQLLFSSLLFYLTQSSPCPRLDSGQLAKQAFSHLSQSSLLDY